MLVTRLRPEQASALVTRHPAASYHQRCGILTLGEPEPALGYAIAVLAAGTADLAGGRGGGDLRRVARAPPSTATTTSASPGVHRLLGQLDAIRRAEALIVVAGMDGALPTLVAGLVRAPVIAVPTSVGYGASFGGLAALLTMLNACSPGVAVVNIDNGYGAAVMAHRICAPRPSRHRTSKTDSPSAIASRYASRTRSLPAKAATSMSSVERGRWKLVSSTSTTWNAEAGSNEEVGRAGAGADDSTAAGSASDRIAARQRRRLETAHHGGADRHHPPAACPRPLDRVARSTPAAGSARRRGGDPRRARP